MKIASYKELIVWQKSMELVIAMYQLTAQFPSSELYALTSQMRRAAVSIASNIAEGSRRGTRNDFRHFLLNSFGSGAELETQIEISKQLSLGTKEAYKKIDNLLLEIMKILNKMISSLQTTNYKLQTTN